MALISRASAAVKDMLEEGSTPALRGAAQRLSNASGASSVAQAVEILDDLKANGVTLSESVEGARKELRTYLGWSPVAPVSMEDALAGLWVPGGYGSRNGHHSCC